MKLFSVLTVTGLLSFNLVADSNLTVNSKENPQLNTNNHGTSINPSSGSSKSTTTTTTTKQKMEDTGTSGRRHIYNSQDSIESDLPMSTDDE